MSAKLKRILAAAALLVSGGGYLVLDAIREANQAEPSPINACAGWYSQMHHRGRGHSLYAIVDAGYTVPRATGDRFIGKCKPRRESIYGEVLTPAECDADPDCVVSHQCRLNVPCGAYVYPYSATTAVGGKRLIRIGAKLGYFVKSWRALRRDAPEVHFAGARKNVRAACLALLTPAQCTNLLGQISPCWRQADGDLCRFGRIATTNRPGVDEACAPDIAADDWYPCTDQGHGRRWGERSQIESLPTDEELDL